MAGTTVAACVFLALAPGAGATTYKPNKTADHTPGACTESDCTLREAITAANGHTGDDVVVVNGGKTYNVTHDPSTIEDANAAADLDITDDLTIKAKGKGYAKLDADHGNRVLDVGPLADVSVTLRDLWVYNGFSTASGAGIRAGSGGSADLRVIHSRVTNSTVISANPGGGIALQNDTSGETTASIVRSTIRDNHSVQSNGGGIAASDVGLVTVKSSTISSNIAGTQGIDGSGGGIHLINATTLEMTNSTVANNWASHEGGGVHSFSATMTLKNVTIARNLADSDDSSVGEGGGMRLAASSSATVSNTILALNHAASPGSAECGQGVGDAITSQGRNLFAVAPSACPAFTSPPNIVQANPRLGQLRSNGGPTKTIALKKGSKAVNRASAAAPSRDQRGVRRRNPDIGAYERR